MPDLTIQVMQMCADLDITHRGDIGGYVQEIDVRTNYWHCSCPAFKYRRNREQSCKHLQELNERMCSYHEQAHGEPDTPGICPLCGGPTVLIKVAV